MKEKKFKHICECTICGNEAEMVVTCTLAEENTEDVTPKVVSKVDGKQKVMQFVHTVVGKPTSGSMYSPSESDK